MCQYRFMWYCRKAVIDINQVFGCSFFAHSVRIFYIYVRIWPYILNQVLLGGLNFIALINRYVENKVNQRLIITGWIRSITYVFWNLCIEWFNLFLAPTNYIKILNTMSILSTYSNEITKIIIQRYLIWYTRL